MKYFVVFFFVFLSQQTFGQEEFVSQKVSATVVNDDTLLPIVSANVININKAKAAATNNRGIFEIVAAINDTLHVSMVGFQSLKVRVTNDWLKGNTTKIQLTEKAIALEEVIIFPYKLTGYLEVDSKLIPSRENYRYSISGLDQAYEAGEYSPTAFGKVLGSLFNPADMLYNFFGKKPKELKRLKEMKKDSSIRGILESRYDRETIATMLGIDKKEIKEILSRCSYSESFAETANDLQILDAISGCYEEYKVLKKR
jgi:CarboxypepD_reg-like domain